MVAETDNYGGTVTYLANDNLASFE